jgi:molybdenum cofactor biosynthesis protein A
MDKEGKSGFVLKDNFGRQINYLRLAVTDRCNLRCSYCMPEEGILSIPHKEILSYEECLRLINIFSALGINKLRITGGEPFVRKGLINFIESVRKSSLYLSILITTNGTLIFPYLRKLKDFGISGINLSLDTLNKEKFRIITQRDNLSDVLRTLKEITKLQIPLKINTVVSNDFNIDEINDLAGIAKNKNIEVRFIEKMPFDGKSSEVNFISAKKLYEILKSLYPGMTRIDENNSTANLFSIPGFIGKIGIIESYTRSFCSTCNRIRITPNGILKTCLYDNGVLDLREMLRANYSDDDIKEAVINCVNKRFVNGFAVEASSKIQVKNSMAAIGG